MKSRRDSFILPDRFYELTAPVYAMRWRLLEIFIRRPGNMQMQ